MPRGNSATVKTMMTNQDTPTPSFALTLTTHPDPATKDQIRRLSDAAFRRPAWSLAGIQPCCPLELLALPEATLFLMRERTSNELAAFAIGLRLTTQSLDYLQLNKLPRDAINGPLPTSGEYHLTWRAVASHFRGQGLGTRLTTARITCAQDLRCEWIYGETIASNFGTIAMHLAMGFHVYYRSDHLGRAGLFQRVYFRKHL